MKKNSLLLMVLAIGLSSCNINSLNSSSEKPTINSSFEENNKEINYSTSINENSLIGIAAYYEFDNNCAGYFVDLIHLSYSGRIAFSEKLESLLSRR